MSTSFILVLALLLDAVLGEPKWLWSRVSHPAVLMGGCVRYLDHSLNLGEAQRLKGVLNVVLLSLGAIALGGVLSLLPWIFEVVIVAVLIAQRSLVGHVRDVANALRLSLVGGRQMVARIVGRDTSQMDGPAVTRAAIESAAENLSDGVIAPAFWFALFGLPGLLFYKIINTADSMIGYRNDRYLDFGWAAARLDDVLNWVPARITALLMLMVRGGLHDFPKVKDQARLHRSPNAGWPEVAAALGLNVALSGPRVYFGKLSKDPFVNPMGRYDVGPDDIDDVVSLLWHVWMAWVAIIFVTAWF